MSSIAVSSIVLAFVFGGALLGMFLAKVLPPEHLSPESTDLVKLGMGLIGTMAALVLGLVLASAKGSYDTEKGELISFSAKVVLLDRVLAHYGPEAKEARDALRTIVASSLDQSRLTGHARHSFSGSPAGAEVFYDKLQELSPKSEEQRLAKSEALNLVINLGQTRWLLLEQQSNSVPRPLLVIVVSWLTVIFISFGLFAPRNGTVIASLFVSALSVSMAIFLILELYSPFRGMIQISNLPLQKALAQLGR